MVAEDDVGRQLGSKSGGVRLDPRVELRSRAVLEELHLVALVAIEDEDWQQTTHVGSYHSSAPEVVTLRVRLLAENDDVVPGAAPFLRERTCIDVRARAAEQIPVPEKDAHA